METFSVPAALHSSGLQGLHVSREVDEGCACQADSPAGTWPGKKSQKACLLAREFAAPRGRQLGVGKHSGHLATVAVWQVSGVRVVFLLFLSPGAPGCSAAYGDALRKPVGRALIPRIRERLPERKGNACWV